VPNQLTLELEPGLTERFGSLRECMNACIYQHGLKRVAMDLDKAPGNLSRMLAGDSGHHFSIELMERYIQTQGDLTPVYYLIARYMGDQAQAEAATMKRVETLLSEVASLVGQTRVEPKTKARR
jgi:hypothetical protein